MLLSGGFAQTHTRALADHLLVCSVTGYGFIAFSASRGIPPAPEIDSRDLVPMTEECACRACIDKPLGLAALDESTPRGAV